MKGDELRRFRTDQGWTQDQLGELLKASLGRGSGTQVGKYEKGQRLIPDEVAKLVAQLQLDQARGGEQPPPGLEPELDFPPSSVEGEPGDTAPPEPGERSRETVPGGQLPLPGGGSYATVCTELWELVATGIGMVGAVTGSDGLRRDGEIIHADRVALGRAWGKLAETNDTFRRLLLSATSGGAWLEVALVSGVTFGKCWRSHQEIGQAKAQAERELEALQAEEHGRGFAEPVAA